MYNHAIDKKSLKIPMLLSDAINRYPRFELY